MTKPPVTYLDHQASTPVDPRVVEAMAPYWTEHYGHPASGQHVYGWTAEHALTRAREEVAALIGADAREIVFVSGGTEADNLAVKGTAEALHAKGRHVVTTAIENRPVRESCAWLEARGFEVTRVPVDGRGRVDPAEVGAALRDDTVLVSVQLANHEVGTLQDLARVGAACGERGVRLHTDATHAAAWLPIDVAALGVHLLSLTAHRMFGPKGIGALYVRRQSPRIRLAPQIHGGAGERGLRAGTLNVPGAVGLGRAAAICREEGAADAVRVVVLRDRLEDGLRARAAGVQVLGDPTCRLPHVSALAIEGVEGESLVLGAGSAVAFATGPACTSAVLEPSYVLDAMGCPKSVVDTSVHLGLGRFTTEADVEKAIATLGDAVERVRAT